MGDANSSTATTQQDSVACKGRESQTSPPLRHKAGSVGSSTMSSLRVVNVSPRSERSQRDAALDDILDSPAFTPRQAPDEPFCSTLEDSISPIASPSPPSVFDLPEEQHYDQHDERYTEPTTGLGSGRDSHDLDPYTLKPPVHQAVQQDGVEALAARFFSAEHLDLILRDYARALRFTRFLDQYRPQYTDTLKQYAQARKAIAAVEYANAIANQLQPPPGHPPYLAATLDERFEAKTKSTVEQLVEGALPAYLTHRLVSLVTDTLVKEITGNSAPIISEMIPSLAEVYCITDPSMPDNPIVYASEEFYTTSQYSKEYVIGRNCRFLQGPQSSQASVGRMIEALTRGEECCETILNYRRDGTPWMNLLMIAPLYDNKGAVRYFLGAQIDVSALIEDGRGLDSFAQLLSQERSGMDLEKDPQQALGDLGQLLTEDEADMFRNRVQRTSVMSHAPASIRSGSTRAANRKGRNSRLILGMDNMPVEPSLWPAATLSSSGRLPGVFQNYLLVRPYPSLRITFTSPTLRIPGLLQSKLLDRVGGPSHVCDGLLDALARGTGVTAKVTWLTGSESKTRWLHCTPLFGGDGRVGVWMVVMVEDEVVTGTLNRGGGGAAITLGSRRAVDRLSSSRLYAQYVATGGGGGGSRRPNTQETSASMREQRETDAVFSDF